MKGYKFLELEQFLTNCDKQVIELSFSDIESILGEKLSKSAYQYPAYWSLSETHTFPHAWINAGYKLDKLDIKGHKAVFAKDSSGKNHGAKYST